MFTIAGKGFLLYNTELKTKGLLTLSSYKSRRSVLFSFIWSDLVWILPVFFVILCYIAGDLVQMLFHVKKGIALKVLSGFVILLCLFHLTSLPFMYNDWPFTTLYNLYLCELICVIITYCILSVVNRRIPLADDLKGLRSAILDTARHRWFHFLLWAAAAALIVWHIAFVILHVSYNVDDNFYVSESVTILSRNRLMDVLPACGIEGSVFPATYILVSWETFLAVLSRLFQVTPAVLCHSVIPALLLPLHYMAFYLAGREIVRKKSAAFLLFVLFLNFVCGPTTYNQGAFLTLRIWQGKAVFVNILLPLLLYAFLRITKKARLSLPDIFLLFSILLASQAATTVGVYLAPVLYGVYAVAFLIIRRKWKAFFKLLIPAAAITPFVLWKIGILLSAGTLDDLSAGTGVYSRPFSEIALRFFGFSLVPLLFLLAIVILALRLKKGPEKALRFFFLISTALMIVFLINPFTMPFVEKYITGTGVYWRLFWLLQTTIVISAGFALLCEIPKLTAARVSLFLFLSCVLLLSGRSIMKDEDIREGFDDPSKVSASVIGIANAVNGDLLSEAPRITEEELKEKKRESVLLLPRTLSLELRQYDDISLIYYAYYSNNYYAYQTYEEVLELQSLYNTLYRKKIWQANELYDSAALLGIDYVAIETQTAQENRLRIPTRFEKVYSDRYYTLYKTNGDRPASAD